MSFKFYEKKETLKYIRHIICGIKFTKKRKIDETASLRDIRTYTMAAAMHRSFEKYRGIYVDRDIVIVGGGPTLKYFQDIPDAVHIGLNLAYKMENVNFDYLFCQDRFPIESDIEGFVNYKPDTCTKVFGLYNNPTDKERVLNSTIGRCEKKEVYILNNRRVPYAIYATDISCEPFVWFAGTVFAALQFAIYTGAKRVYLAGFDCTDGVGHAFYDTNIKSYSPYSGRFAYNLKYQLKSWQQFKEYLGYMHSNFTEFVSVNPVTLQGMFKDVYTQSYLNEHPEIKDAELLGS